MAGGIAWRWATGLQLVGHASLRGHLTAELRLIGVGRRVVDEPGDRGGFLVFGGLRESHRLV